LALKYKFAHYREIAINRYRRSYSIITPFKINSSAISYFIINYYRRSYNTTTPSKINSSAISHFVISRRGADLQHYNPFWNKVYLGARF
jgi:hypothetical protein